MGTPSRQAQLILGHPVTAEELLIADRIVIVEHVLSRCGPSLKYMPGFREIKDWIDGGIPFRPDTVRCTEKTAAIDFNEGLSRETRCVELSHIAFKEMTSSEARTEREVESITLMLAQDGGIIRWTNRYYKLPNLQRRGTSLLRDPDLEVTTSAKFELISSEELWKMLEPAVLTTMVRSLRHMVEEATNERRKRLTSMERLLSSLSDIEERIPT